MASYRKLGKKIRGRTRPNRNMHALLRFVEEEFPEELTELDGNTVDIFGLLVDIAEKAFHKQDWARMLLVADKLHEFFPAQPTARILLGQALFHAGYLASGLARIRKVHDLHGLEIGAEARKQLANLESMVLEAGFFELSNLEFEAARDDVRYHLERGRAAVAEREARRFLTRYPDEPVTLNNLSLARCSQGDPGDAIRLAGRVRRLEPGNLHATANLVRFLVLSGRFGEAAELGEELKKCASPGCMRNAKVAEALSYLGDHEGVLQAFEAASAQEKPLPFLLHLAGTAAGRLGRWPVARHRWQQAAAAGLSVAAANVENADLPESERWAPWAFTVDNWFSSAVLRRFTSARGGSQAKALRDLMRTFPYLRAALPAFLELGDPATVQLACRLALEDGSVESLDTLQAFAEGASGNRQERLRIVTELQECGRLSVHAPVRFFDEGDWRELEVRPFSITWKPRPLPPPLDDLVEQASRAAKEEDFELAEELLLKARKLDRRQPVVLHNLAVVYRNTRRTRKARKLLVELHRAHPDYAFGRITLAHLNILDRDFETARQLLKPVTQLIELHIAEFAACCGAHIALFEMKGDGAAADSWRGLWERLEVEEPDAVPFRPHVMKGPFESLRQLRQSLVWEEALPRGA